MTPDVDTSTPSGTMAPIGPYSHVARVGPFITIGGIAGVDPRSGELAGPDAYTQAAYILDAFRLMLESQGSDVGHIVHINVFLLDMRDFAEVNRAFIARLGDHRPARTTIGVSSLPKTGAVVTMNLTAVAC